MWKDIVTALINSGLTQYEIAARVGISQPHVSDLANGHRGKRIGFELGNKLLALHAERCRDSCAAPARTPSAGDVASAEPSAA